jgi:hypothetical protein
MAEFGFVVAGGRFHVRRCEDRGMADRLNSEIDPELESV